MMTNEKLQRIIEKISYKPGVKLYGNRLPDAGYVEFAIKLLTKDVRYPEDPLATITREHVLYEFFVKMEEKDIVEIFHGLIVKAELHEVDEWLKVSGKCRINPHPENSDYEF